MILDLKARRKSIMYVIPTITVKIETVTFILYDKVGVKETYKFQGIQEL